MYSTWTCVSMKPVAYWRSCTLDDDDDDELPPPDDDDDEPPPRRPPRRPPPPPPRPRPRWDWDWDWVLMGCVGERGRAAEDDDGSERAAPTSLLDARNESRTASPTTASQSISLLCVRVCDHSCARGDDSARYEIERSRFIITAIRIMLARMLLLLFLFVWILRDRARCTGAGNDGHTHSTRSSISTSHINASASLTQQTLRIARATPQTFVA